MDTYLNSDFLNRKKPVALSFGVKSLDYLHLIEVKNDLRLPKNVDDKVNLFFFLDPVKKFYSYDPIYTEETEYSSHITDFPSYQLEWFFEGRKRFYQYLNKNGFEIGHLFESVTYDYRFYFHRYSNSCVPLRLGSIDLKTLLSKKSSLDLRAWGGHLFKEFRLKILNSKNRAQAFASVLKLIEKCEYCKYHDPYVLGCHLELYLALLDRLYSRGEMPTYSANVIQLLQLFTHSQKVVKILLRSRFVDVRNLVNISRREKYTFFNLWDHSNDKSTMQLSDLISLYSMKNTEILLLKGGTSSYSSEAYQSFKEMAGFIIDEEFLAYSFSEEFLANLTKVEKSDRIKYRCLQTIHIYDESLYSDRNPIRKSPAKSVLKLIWKSSAEPFLTEEDFISLSVTVENRSADNFLRKAWQWYMSNVGMKDISLKETPRTLYHLSAVTIRKQLVQCFNFPDGIPELPLPKHLKKDLHLSIQENNISIIPN